MENLLLTMIETCLIALGVLVASFLCMYMYSDKCEELTFKTDTRRYRISKKVQEFVESWFGVAVITIVAVIMICAVTLTFCGFCGEFWNLSIGVLKRWFYNEAVCFTVLGIESSLIISYEWWVHILDCKHYRRRELDICNAWHLGSLLYVCKSRYVSVRKK